MAIMQFHNFRRMHENGVSLAEIMASNILHFNTLQFQLQPVYVFPVSIYATFLLVTSTRHTVFINHVFSGIKLCLYPHLTTADDNQHHIKANSSKPEPTKNSANFFLTYANSETYKLEI